jgi:hypothetical protein
VTVVAVGVAIYSLVYSGLAARTGEEDRLPDAIYHLALGVGALAAGFGALRLHRWAWAVFMSWAVIGLTHQILRYIFFEDPNFADMAINTLAVLALSPLEVQIAFGYLGRSVAGSSERSTQDIARQPIWTPVSPASSRC